MSSIRKLSVVALVAMVFAAFSMSGAILAASSASITFDFSDLGDLADGPEYNIVGTGLVDDDGLGCDEVVVLIVDATGTITDIDEICLDTLTGQGGSDGDYGSNDTGYVPTAGPATYAVFDLTAADLANLSGLTSDQAYFDYVVANALFLTEGYVDVDGLTSGTPFSFMASSPSSGCRLAIPAGSVVGEAPLGAQVYYEPGNVSPGVVLNAGTYTVVGQDASETYYKLFFSCSFIWVRKDTMQPSWQAPQNGAPLPTTIVS